MYLHTVSIEIASLTNENIGTRIQTLILVLFSRLKDLVKKNSQFFILSFLQRKSHITCQPDPMAPDPDKQTTVSVNYLLTE